MTASLTYGAIDLTCEPFRAYTDADFGAPVPVTTAMARLLLDGEVVSGDRSSNRQLVFTIEIEGEDAIELAEYESQLVAEVNAARNTLTWDPGDGLGAPSVYETYRAALVFKYDDAMDASSIRVYTLTIPAMPFARSVSQVVAPALSNTSTPTTTLIDGCNATTGWTGTNTVTVNTSSYATSTGSLTESATLVATQISNGTTYQFEGSFTRTGAIDFTGLPYVTIQARTPTVGSSFIQGVQMWADGVELQQVSVEWAPTVAGWNRYRFYCSDMSVTTLKVRVSGIIQYLGGGTLSGYSVAIDDLNKTNVLNNGGTARESLRSIPIAGSVRTPGTLSVSHGTSALGDTLVYTCADLGNGYRPDLRRWRTAGTSVVTTDAATISGATEPLQTSATYSTFTVPAATLAPGAYVLMARVLASVAGTYTLSGVGQTVMGANSVGVAQSVSSTMTVGTSYAIVPIGVLHLPPTVLSNSTAGSVQVQIYAAAGSPGIVTLDEGWLFNLDGVLTQVAAGTGSPVAGGASNRLWVDSPTVDQPQGGVWIGTQADRSDARYAGPSLAALGQHLFAPPQTAVFVVTSGALAPDVSLSHYPRWHTVAAS